uniref:NADH dehydrogenase subunit 2 n=1 Tax=Exitianus nanus TaxID=1401695 RepID=UPI0021D5249D|nr:NADH dehydrogenase subunit 2 [Exitianus nanus]UXD78652.1 NADH dehydrogenase subunit 2 [Exitianus nanus]
MSMNSTKSLLVNSMMIGVIITICSNNWISMWMGMEVSLISFIPLMLGNKKNTSQSMIKYFIMQTVASTMFLFSVICMLVGDSMTNEMFMMISMLMKLGVAPFHSWVLMVIEPLELSAMFIMLTVLKIPPLAILYQINTSMLNYPIIMSMLVSSISSLNQSSLRKMMGFSSIYNISIMVMSINSLKVSMVFIMIYSMNMFMLISVMENMKANFINQLMVNEFSLWVKLNLWINMLSMAGFPPLMGFIPKLMVAQLLILNNQMLLVSIMMMTSMLILMFYTRMVFSSMLTSQTQKKWTICYTKPMHFLMSINIMMTTLSMTFNSLA